MNQQTYSVTGMTCGHCVAAVTEEVGKIDGVSDVAVDLEHGLVTLTSAEGVDLDVVAGAVDEAGYELVRN